MAIVFVYPILPLTHKGGLTVQSIQLSNKVLKNIFTSNMFGRLIFQVLTILVSFVLAGISDASPI